MNFIRQTIKTSIVLLTFALLLSNCGVKNKRVYFNFNKNSVPIKIVEFTPVDSFYVKAHPKTIKGQIIETDSGLVIPSFSWLGTKFYFDNISTGSTLADSFGFKLKEVNECVFINKDSILMLFEPYEQGGLHDSIVLLGNSSGEIQKVFSVKSNTVYSHATPKMYNNDNAVSRTPNFYGNSYQDKKLFIHFINETGTLGNSFGEGLPIIGYIDLSAGDFVPLNISYPDIEYEKTFFNETEKQFISDFAHDGDLLCGFKYTPTMLKYNIDTKDVKRIGLKSSLIDTIYPSIVEKDVPKGYDTDMPYPKYYSFKYDKYRNYYYRFIMYPKEFNNGNGCYALMVADTNFNVVAEGFLPNFQGGVIIAKDYVLAYGKSNKPGSFLLVAYKMSFRDGTNQELIGKLNSNKEKRQKSKGTLADYATEQGKITAKNYTSTFITYEQVCGNTFDFYMSAYKQNNKYFKQYDVYLFIQTRYPETVRKALAEKYGLPLNENPNIFIDSTFNYSTYTNYALEDLARNIKVRKNKIVTDTVFDLDDAGVVGFQEFLINSGKEQLRLKK